MKVNVKALIKNAEAIVKKRSPEILTGIGIAGMATSTIFAVKATPKAMMLIEERKLDLDTDHISKLEVVKTVWPCYIPTVATTVASAACLIGASTINFRRNAALAAAYALSESTLKDYQEKVIETIGDKKSGEVRDAIAKDKLEKNPYSGDAIVVTDNNDTLCYEPLSGRYFRSNIDKIKRALNEVNRMMLSADHISLNDFYCEIGLGETKLGDDLGWRLDTNSLIDMHFSTHLAKNGEPCLVLDFITAPVYDYSRIL